MTVQLFLEATLDARGALIMLFEYVPRRRQHRSLVTYSLCAYDTKKRASVGSNAACAYSYLAIQPVPVPRYSSACIHLASRGVFISPLSTLIPAVVVFRFLVVICISSWGFFVSSDILLPLLPLVLTPYLCHILDIVLEGSGSKRYEVLKKKKKKELTSRARSGRGGSTVRKLTKYYPA
ncbi:hypothetical protein FB446DRAFT_820254 [Lentinula raphanica]|nr:hypothetical protein FB446DRAFT_820254 [Lentinula raphanica]